MESQIIQNGRLTVPLFHGTSTLFYDSIRSAGLGGVNIVEEMGIGRHNFELIQPIPAHQLRFQRVSKLEEFDGEGGSRKAIRLEPFNSD